MPALHPKGGVWGWHNTCPSRMPIPDLHLADAFSDHCEPFMVTVYRKPDDMFHTSLAALHEDFKSTRQFGDISAAYRLQKVLGRKQRSIFPLASLLLGMARLFLTGLLLIEVGAVCLLCREAAQTIRHDASHYSSGTNGLSSLNGVHWPLTETGHANARRELRR